MYGKTTTTMALTREDWISAAVTALRQGGIEGVRVDVLARDLDVSRGSFYWHFKDRDDLLETILARWEEETDWLIRGAREAATPRERIARFFELANASPYPPDREILAWARRDAKVARRVQLVEEKRIAFFEELMVEDGLRREQAKRFGEILYLATLGWLERRWRNPDGGYAFERFSREVADLLLNSPAQATRTRARTVRKKR